METLEKKLKRARRIQVSELITAWCLVVGGIAWFNPAIAAIAGGALLLFDIYYEPHKESKP